MYVDDIVVMSSSSSLIDDITSKLSKEFSVKDLGALSFFLGIHVNRSKEGIFLSQQQYISNLLNDKGFGNVKPASTPMEPKVDLTQASGTALNHEDTTRYRRILGCLQYLTTTRMDISYAIYKLSQFFTNPNSSHWQALQHVLRYVSGLPFLGIMLRPSLSTIVEAFSNADWAGDASDQRSHGGFVVYYGGNIVSWRSKKQATVARSSTEAEFKSLTDDTAEVIWVTEVLRELGAPTSGQSTVWCESSSAISLSANPVLHNTTKHVAVSFHFVHEKVVDGSLLV